MRPFRTYKHKTKEEINAISSEYLSGASTMYLVDKYNSSRTTVLSILKKNNIQIRKDFRRKGDLTQRILEFHKMGMTSKEIGQELGVSHELVQSRINKSGFLTNKFYYRSKRHINDNYFEDINTQEKAYFLGLLFADGNVSSKKNKISINLKKQDAYLIEKFKEDTQSDYRLSEKAFKNNPNWESQMYIQVYSKKMKEDLIRHGCTPKKSKTLIFPEIKKEKFWHFVRGYFDGDGCISGVRNKQITIAGSLFFNLKLKEILFNEYGIVAQIRVKSETFSILVISRREYLVKMRELMYDGATILMLRKYKKFYQ